MRRCVRCDRVLVAPGKPMGDGEARRAAKGMCSACYSAATYRGRGERVADGSALLRAVRGGWESLWGVPVVVSEEQCEKVRELFVAAGMPEAAAVFGIAEPS